MSLELKKRLNENVKNALTDNVFEKIKLHLPHFTEDNYRTIKKNTVEYIENGYEIPSKYPEEFTSSSYNYEYIIELIIYNLRINVYNLEYMNEDEIVDLFIFAIKTFEIFIFKYIQEIRTGSRNVCPKDNFAVRKFIGDCLGFILSNKIKYSALEIKETEETTD